MRSLVESIVHEMPVTDIHTHLFAPEMNGLLFTGADHMLSYHYLVAELFRVHPMSYDKFWNLSAPEQVEWVWRYLFEETSPLSEASQGVLMSAKALGYAGQKDLAAFRAVFSDSHEPGYVEKILSLSRVSHVVMTNDPFNSQEEDFWTSKREPLMPAFRASLRLDVLANTPEQALRILNERGYDVEMTLAETSKKELGRFLDEWQERTDALYVAMSWSGAFAYPHSDWSGRLLDDVLLPWCHDHHMPLALMIGVRRQVNPGLKDAGDGLAETTMDAVIALCQRWPQNKFLLTALSREAQYPLTVAARKFPNLMIFGAWWFLNTRSLLQEITQMRMELLGPTFVVQHSDARVLEQLIYKWKLARDVLVRVLNARYQALEDMGWKVSRADMEREVGNLLSHNFWRFIGREP